ncbi:hypothetical protein Achl_4353 (plasmid) [Pseudarthrobacter chlorophenolicus A6]|uniref:Uncharacterized protein n=1 Tax=Pseudarthrobacter chlorophenolicus (strain ATCC 700700 / DSM 12829 / CIP 107037 / JCM 12360 / KCTC 9906 / NCIMB 13794 / A6) TaxID=452863 RepID=B8HIQ7_PSECP|nr:hypothetical protein [Pseudarthrobacter chlorophenolicus]ACL42304.1 hypothetical protein Achl_4353 [Pseudarthrobacter chlorophenolicus A6]SDQ16242.1 hypothetical protein SAMN04489738_0410 [Pseudarthrobacter chlorophenolicus]
MRAMDIYAEPAADNTASRPYGDATYQIVDQAAGGVVAYCHSASASRIVAALKEYDHSITAATDLGTLIEALAACDPAAEVLLDYGGTLAQFGKATYCRSWHNDLALTPDGTDPKTAAQLLDILRDIRANGFTRPGVERSAHDGTGVWVAKYREPSNLHIVGIRNDGPSVVVLTEERP